MDIKNKFSLFLLNLFNIPEKKIFKTQDVAVRVNEINNRSVNMTSLILKDTCIQLNKKYNI